MLRARSRCFCDIIRRLPAREEQNVSGHQIDRRNFLKATALASITTNVITVRDAHAQIAVPNSAGTAPPKLKAPANACDCHMHIYDPARFPMPPSQRVAPMNAAVPQYRLLQQRIGTSRVIVVQPRNYAIDNRVTLDALNQFAPNVRGVAVLHPTVTDAELKTLNDAGIRGIRFSLGDPATAAVTPGMVEPLAKRVADLGWHVQFNVEGRQIVELADVLRRLPTPMVFDHLANPGPMGVDHPSHAIVRGLMDRGRTWVKLSGAYSNSRMGPPYPEATRIAQAFVKAAPERLVWGSDWPHPGVVAVSDKPDDAFLFDLLALWVPDEAMRDRILVQNPETLYGFPKT
jgi:predicted TIM-barrel fold metal-dependent hydrolase